MNDILRDIHDCYVIVLCYILFYMNKFNLVFKYINLKGNRDINKMNPEELSKKIDNHLNGVNVDNNDNKVNRILGISNRGIQMERVQREGLELFERKNKDYGDAFATYGTIGVLVRMGDKISRLQSIKKNGVTMINDEKMRDTLIDLHNYSAMAIMLLDEKDDDSGKEQESNDLIELEDVIN